MEGRADRILTTHIGSLPRSSDLLALMHAAQQGNGTSTAAFAARVRDAVTDSVTKQAAIGLDIVNDGEQGKPSFLSYISDRLSGLESGPPRGSPWQGSREEQDFPEFYAASGISPGATAALQTICTGPIEYRGQEQLRAELDLLKEALAGVEVLDAFVPSISPTNVEWWLRNEYYPTHDEYLYAIADAMHEEFRAIVDAGFVLQVDDPRLVTHYALTPGLTVEECRVWANERVDALNHALRGLPEERIRFHTCYSINMGPRIHDMELKDIVDVILRINAGAYSFEAANPRHDHEWRVFEEVALPEGKVLIPGVISHSTVLVEHPQLVADRLARYASVVGRDNVIAGADCGFSSFAGPTEIHESIVWKKLEALVEGARLASNELWGRG